MNHSFKQLEADKRARELDSLAFNNSTVSFHSESIIMGTRTVNGNTVTKKFCWGCFWYADCKKHPKPTPELPSVAALREISIDQRKKNVLLERGNIQFIIISAATHGNRSVQLNFRFKENFDYLEEKGLELTYLNTNKLEWDGGVKTFLAKW